MKKNPEDASEILEFKFLAKKKISHDTFIFTYEIPNDYNLGLNLGQHIAIEWAYFFNIFDFDLIQSILS